MAQRINYFEYGQVYPPADAPLAGGNGPVVPPELDAGPEPVSPRFLLWTGVFGCIVTGAWLCGLGWRWQTPGTPICAGAWVLICLLAILRAWRRSR